MAERGLEPSPAAVAALPPEVRAQLAELELELSEGRRAAGGGRRLRARAARLRCSASPPATRLAFHCCPGRDLPRAGRRQSCRFSRNADPGSATARRFLLR